MPDPIRMQLLGGLEIEVEGSVLGDSAFERRQAASLVKLLGLNGRRLHREQVIDVLWPEAGLDEASPRLHQVASYARKALDDKEALVLRDDQVLLWPDRDVAIDVEEFEVAADLAHSGSIDEAEAAADLYTGELLPADPYEEWAVDQRDRLRLRYLDVLRTAGRWEALLEVEPADEQAHLALMRGFVAEGQRLATLRQFERLERALDDELGMAPGDEAIALRSSVLDDSAQTADLVDRTNERRLMQQTLDDAAAGVGSLLLLTGVAGIGKTTLSEWLTDRAEQLGFVTGRGVAASIDGTWPYAPVLEAIADVLHKVPELMDELPASHQDELRRVRGAPTSSHDRPADGEGHQRLFVAVDALVRAAARSRGLVLFIDDLHVADDASLAMVHYIARQAARSRLLIVGTARSGVETEGLAALRGLVGRHGAREVHVGPLGQDHARELVAQVAASDAPADTVERIVALGGGTPFYLQEMTRSLGHQGDAGLPDQAAAIAAGAFRGLPESLTDVLTRVAVAGERVDTDQFVALSGLDEAEAFDMLDQALAAEVLEHTSGGYQFRHGLMRESLLDGLAPHRRRLVHREAAARFEAMGAPPSRIYHHLVEAGDLAAAAPWGLLAARAAEAVGALSDARAVIDAVVDHGEGQTRIEMLALRADVLTGMGDPGAVPAYQLALQETEGPIRRLLRAKLARAALMGGAVDVAMATLDGLEPDGGPFDGPVLHAQGMLAYFAGDLDTAEACAEQARQYALADGAPAALLDVLTLQGMVSHNRGEWFDRMRVELTSTADSKELASTIFDCHL